MAFTLRSKRKNTAAEGACNALGERTYSVTYEVEQTDGGTLGEPMDILLAAMALSGSPTSGAGDARVPAWGEEYSFGGFTDTDSFLQNITWRRPSPEHHFGLWHFDLSYGPARNLDPGIFTEPNPLLWPVVFDLDWISEQVPLDAARVVEDLSHVGRSANSLGPVINSCGVEFTEPLLKTVYYPILIAKKNYATLDEIVALNLAYQGTTNDGTYFGASQRKAKYLQTASGGRQQVNGQVYYPGTTRIWFKRATWDRPVLNNGWSHFRIEGGDYLLDDAGNPKLFKNKVHDNPAAAADAEPDADCSEPLNLALDGTLQPSDTSALYLTFRDLEEVDYTGIGIGG